MKTPTTIVRAAVAILIACIVVPADAQKTIDPTPSRQVLEDAAAAGCDGVSTVVRRCADQPQQTGAKDGGAKDAAGRSIDPLTRSRDAAKQSFDRRDQRGRDDALKGEPPPTSTPVGDATRLGDVTVTGKGATDAPNVEDVLQRALAPTPSSKTGTVSHFSADGTRYDCVEKCYGPACCVAVRSMPDPAHNSNSIGR